MGYRGEIKFKFKPTLAFMEFGGSEDPYGICRDSDYFDFVGMAGNIRKDSTAPMLYKVGDKIGQIIIMPYPEVSFIEVDELSSSERGEGGFGSTGLSN